MVLSRWWPTCISWTIYHPLVTCSCFFRSVLFSGPVMPQFWSWTFSSVRYALRNASRWRQEKAILFMAVMKRMDPARAWWWSWPPLPGRRDDGWAVGWCRGLVSGVGWGIPFWRCEGGWEVFFLWLRWLFLLVGDARCWMWSWFWLHRPERGQE